ncbi:hypothetical protein [Paenibacillus cymbidii]|uniref:hypothetical protein n=1 Tax=Paenibacillus cymbidii TaxID=1639034 RepID=UPI001080172F|nr:hypothetical protein [Paenibacillus cymbidii]
MKIIAITSERGDGKYLVEVSGQELCKITCYSQTRFDIGTTIDISPIYDASAKVIANEKTVIDAVKKLRAMADLIESIEPTITTAIYPPESEAQRCPE